MTDDRELIDGRYRVFGAAGSGGYSEVYLGWDEDLQRDVALKVLSGSCSGQSYYTERFVAEARTGASLAHPNICRVYDYGRSSAVEGAHYMVMEYVGGGTLADYLARKGPLPEPVAAEVALQLADALGAAHDGGLIHRDVKPSNVLLDAEGNVKLSDFGIATVAGRPEAGPSGRRGPVVGTASYMSPEQVRGDGSLTEASDLYSLGVVLYEMLTDEVPFRAESTGELFGMHLEHAPLDPAIVGSGVSGPMAAVVLGLLEKDPARRYRDAGALAEDLEYLVGGGVPPWVRRHAEAGQAPLRSAAPGRSPVRKILTLAVLAGCGLALTAAASMFALGVGPASVTQDSAAPGAVQQSAGQQPGSSDSSGAAGGSGPDDGSGGDSGTDGSGADGSGGGSGEDLPDGAGGDEVSEPESTELAPEPVPGQSVDEPEGGSVGEYSSGIPDRVFEAAPRAQPSGDSAGSSGTGEQEQDADQGSDRGEDRVLIGEPSAPGEPDGPTAPEATSSPDR